jgi:membrane-associated phospholipid phosphatase
MNVQSSRQRIAAVYVSLFAATALAYFFGDRQLAEALKPITGGVALFPKLTHIVDILPPLASIGVAVTAARAMARGSLSPAEWAILRLSCAILIAWALKEELKWAFGRTWPETWLKPANPSYFGDGTFGFFPFHGGQAYASFPSGHTTAITAFAGSAWFLCPRLRWLGVAATACVVVGLLGADYHWLSDIVAGGTLGATVGAVAARIGRGEPEKG